MDKYELGQSEVGTITEEINEIRLDLQLEKNHYFNNVLIYGYVYDFCNKPLKNAKVVFCNEFNTEVGSVYTSYEGLYVYFGAKLNSIIKIVIQKSGYYKHFSEMIFIDTKMFRYNAWLQKKNFTNRVLISGHIKDYNCNPVGNIPVYLLKTCNYCGKFIFKVTNSNEFGQFVFYDIPLGSYIVYIDDPKFELYSEEIQINESDKIFDIDVRLNKRPPRTRMYGCIKDDLGRPIKNAVVILFRVEWNGKLIPIKYTITDTNGEYIFDDLPYGNYVVKAM